MYSKNIVLKKLYKTLTIILCAFWICFALLFAKNCIERAYFYPVKYKELVLENAQKTQIPYSTVFAIINIESNFNASAKSNKGAVGLMQITPDTAKYTAEINNISDYDLFTPSDNIKIGCLYLKYLLDKFNVIETAVVAYNAGEGNVNKWLKDKEFSEDSKHLKNIPFNESKEYLLKYEKSFEKYNKLYLYILDK